MAFEVQPLCNFLHQRVDFRRGVVKSLSRIRAEGRHDEME